MKSRMIGALAAATAGLLFTATLSFAEEAKLPVIHGQVTKVDESAGKLTIKHEAITNLDMGAMTMVFKAKDPALLKDVKPGDSIVFTADKVNDQITVMSLEKSK